MACDCLAHRRTFADLTFPVLKTDPLCPAKFPPSNPMVRGPQKKTGQHAGPSAVANE